MVKFWPTLQEARQDPDLGAVSIEEDTPIIDGRMRWPSVTRLATATMPDGSTVRLRRVDCYGWRVSQ